MDISAKKAKLFDAYRQFEESSKPFMDAAVCRIGCADCCTNVGDVDSTTLEAFLILGHMKNLTAARQKEVAKKLKQNRKERSESRLARCAFLQPDNTCAVYEFRPFSCRRLYSIKTCGVTGPTIHRQAWNLARQTEAAIQELDHTGYSGHLSYVIQLLNDATFLKTYLGGGFNPDAISDFALKHNIIINRYVEHLRNNNNG